jgi:hypothetical protein
MPTYTPGESLILPQRGRGKTQSSRQIIVLAVSGNDVILEFRFDNNTSSLKKYDWRSPLSEQSGRTIAYEDLSIWELRDIVQAGVVWQGRPRSGALVPTATALYQYKQWLSDFVTFCASQKKALVQLLNCLDWPLTPSWSSGGCAIAAEAIQRWLVAQHYQAGLALAEFGEIYLRDAHLYTLLRFQNNNRLIDTKGVYTEALAYKRYSTPCRISDITSIDQDMFVFDESFCHQITTALSDRFGACEPLRLMIQNAWSKETDGESQRPHA